MKVTKMKKQNTINNEISNKELALTLVAFAHEKRIKKLEKFAGLFIVSIIALSAVGTALTVKSIIK